MDGDKLVDFFLKNSNNSLLKAFPLNIARREILNLFEAKKIIQKVSAVSSIEKYSITPFGSQLIQVFLA